MRYLFLIYLLSICPIIGLGQNVTIAGNAMFFANEPIEIFQFKNRLTSETELISSSLISGNGEYSFQIELDKPKEILVKIEMRSVILHLHPQTRIRLDLLPISIPENQRIPLKYRISYVELPQDVATDSVYQSFPIAFAKMQLKIGANSNIQKIYSSFFATSDSMYETYIQSDSLFKVYYTYYKADAYLQTRIPKQKLIMEYIYNQPIHYQSLEYQNFFSSIISPRIHQLFTKNAAEFEKAKKEYKVYDSFMKLLELDTLLNTNEMRSLAIFHYVTGNASRNMLDQENKKAIISQMANFCAFEIQKNAARYFQRDKKILAQNREAPIFKVHNTQGDVISLEDFRGNSLYLGFINSKSYSSIQDLQVIKNLSKKYKNQQYLLILTDRDSVDYSNFPPETNNLHYANLDCNFEILETYEIWSYPIYYLLDKHGYFLESPSVRPNEMYTTFEKMYAKKPRGKRYEIIND